MKISELIKFCAATYFLVILVELLRSHKLKRFLLELLPLLVLMTLDVLLASASAGYLTFGPSGSSLWVVLAMFISIILGVVARYIFDLKGGFSWLEFAKPLFISPLLLLPLIGSLEPVKSLEPIQVVMFALLAFQNGFFWKVVLQRENPKK